LLFVLFNRSKMRFLSLVINVLPLTRLVYAAPAPADEDPVEVAASRRVVKLHRTYQKNILDSIKHRKAGCIEKKLLRRQEWYVPDLSTTKHNHTPFSFSPLIPFPFPSQPESERTQDVS
jgi:hypothetical protein